MYSSMLKKGDELMILSLEYLPLLNGKAISARDPMRKLTYVTGLSAAPPPWYRMSWLLVLECSTAPAPRNSRALKKP